MRDLAGKRRTIGFISSWHVYEETTIDAFMHELLQGIYAATRDHDCNLLLACGVGPLPSPGLAASAWPVLSPDADFVPVGPWNVDGIVVAPHPLTSGQSAFVQQLLADGFPIVFIGPEEPGPAVIVDAAGGFREAFNHLLAHGHHRIAFIAGMSQHTVDSNQRLQAYLDALQAANLQPDPQLIAYGEASLIGGRQAMRQILATGAPFTAVLANNDRSAFGAIEALREAGLRIPEQVAVIGFDDILEARAFTPPLTTVRQPTFALGYQAVLSVLDRIAGRSADSSITLLPTRLVIRASCGCRSGKDLPAFSPDLLVQSMHAPMQMPVQDWAHAMAAAVLRDAHFLKPADVEANCQLLLERFIESLDEDIDRQGSTAFDETLHGILHRSESIEDMDAWGGAIAELRRVLPTVLTALQTPAMFPQPEMLLNRAQLTISDQSRQLAMRGLIQHMVMADQLGMLTAQLLAALDESQVEATLIKHLPYVQIRNMLVARFAPQDNDPDDPVALSDVLFCHGLSKNVAGERFVTRLFPPRDFYAGEEPFQLVLLPLVAHDQITGFVAFDAANLEPCAAIVRNLAAALRSSHLYRDAVEAQHLAEQANQIKSRFLSMVSHELRTPLNLIVGLSEMLVREQRQLQPESDSITQDLHRIHTNAQHLGLLISDVLDLASSEAGQLRLMRETLDLCEVLRVVIETGQQMAREKGLRWQAEMPQEPVWVMGDRTRLRQIVLNLISNAVKFTTSGAVTLTVTVEAGQLRAVVSDTGLGVPIAEQAHIFEEFQRSERTVARGFSGLGLGLAICKQLVELHGGTIGVHSSGVEGRGSSFFFTLPTISTEASPAASPSKLLEPLHQQSVVLLTACAGTETPLAAYLHERGFDLQVCCVDAGDDWLQQLLAANPGAIILDDQLAVQHGWQIIGALKRHRATAHVPLLVFAVDESQTHGALLELNYERKPIEPNQLAQILSHQGLAAGDSTSLKTILIVDDEPDTLELHTRLVRQLSPACRVLQAQNGREALDAMRRTRPDLVLLDLMMPELDGFGVLGAMRAEETLRDVPVVVLTAQTLSENDMERLNRGVASILSKGLFSAQEVLSHIEAALDHNQKLGSATQRLVRKAISYIQTHYAEPLSRDRIARHVGVAEGYLTTCFHQELGIPPMTYLMRWRIKQARALLEAGLLNVTEVALTVGFSDSAHFSRVFQREVGVSPNTYRRGKRAQR